MSSKSRKSVSESLETDEFTLPYLPYLLQDLWALGSSVEDIIHLLQSLNLPRGETNVLDLGCGKGAVSIQVAEKLGFKVTGIDAMEPFIAEAKHRANELQVSHLCKFLVEDIFDYASAVHNFDIVILASLGGIFKTNKNTISVLRSQVKSNGYILIDDGYLKTKSSVNRKGYAHYKDYQETVNDLLSFKDQLIEEVNTTEKSIRINYEYLSSIEKRAAELMIRNNEIKSRIEKYIKLQREECDFLKEEVEGAVWLIRKRND